MSFDAIIHAAPKLGAIGTSTKTGANLNNAYTRTSAGNCVLFRFCAPVSAKLKKVLVFTTGVTGSPGLVVDLCNYTAPDTLGSLIRSVAWNPVGASKWASVAFDDTLVAGTYYWIVVGDPDGNGGTFAAVAHKGSLGSTANQNAALQAYTSSNGGGTLTSQAAGCVVLVFEDGTTMGQPFTGLPLIGSSTHERGILINPPQPLVLSGLAGNFVSGNLVNVIKIYGPSMNPGDTPLYSLTVDDGFNTASAIQIPRFILEAGCPYRIVVGFSANSSAPGLYQIEDYASFPTELGAASFLSGAMAYTEAVSGAWVDSYDEFPRMWLTFADIAALATASGNVGGIGAASFAAR